MSFPKSLASDGFIDLGTVQWQGPIIIGDPALLDDAALTWSGRVRPGNWRLMFRTEGDSIVEFVAVVDEELSRFYDAYDAVEGPIAITASSGRIAMIDAGRRDDLVLRKDMLEIDDFPWVIEQGCVAEAVEAAWVFTSGESEISLVALAFGERPHVATDRVALDS